VKVAGTHWIRCCVDTGPIWVQWRQRKSLQVYKYCKILNSWALIKHFIILKNTTLYFTKKLLFNINIIFDIQFYIFCWSHPGTSTPQWCVNLEEATARENYNVVIKRKKSSQRLVFITSQQYSTTQQCGMVTQSHQRNRSKCIYFDTYDYIWKQEKTCFFILGNKIRMWNILNCYHVLMFL
jgi:hypothetical protein